jgi:hypothetical protein
MAGQKPQLRASAKKLALAKKLLGSIIWKEE